MKPLATVALALALLAPLATSAAEQMIPNNMQRIGAANTGDTPLDYSDVNVAVVDTGIDLANPDLNVVGGVDCTDGTNPFALSTPFADTAFHVEAYTDASWAEFRNPDARGFDDGMGHGTHVAGIIGAKDDGRGVVGVAPNASLWSVRVLDASGSGSIGNIICGLDWVHQNRDLIDVVNMSLGADLGVNIAEHFKGCYVAYNPVMPSERREEDPLHQAICQLAEDGIPVVVAAGNGNGLAEQTVPAAYPEVITVSNFVDNDGLPGGLGGRNDEDVCPFGGADDMLFYYKNFTPEQRFSSYEGEAVDIAAPGVCILSTVPGGFAAFTGTSMASPHVAGALARLIGDTPALRSASSVRLRSLLLDQAEPQPATFRDADDFHEPIVHVQ